MDLGGPKLKTLDNQKDYDVMHAIKRIAPDPL